jgi:hypothetical protein
MRQSIKTRRRAVIAEYAFSLFVERRRNSSSVVGETLEQVAWSTAAQRLAPYANQGLDIEGRLNDDEAREVEEIAISLARFFNASKPVVLRPVFAGCGYVDASEGDVIFGSTLYEVKTVERPVRSSDLRQTIAAEIIDAIESGRDIVEDRDPHVSAQRAALNERLSSGEVNAVSTAESLKYPATRPEIARERLSADDQVSAVAEMTSKSADDLSAIMGTAVSLSVETEGETRALFPAKARDLAIHLRGMKEQLIQWLSSTPPEEV